MTTGRDNSVSYFCNHIHALDHLSKDNVMAVEPGCVHCCDEKLRSIRVLSGVGHRDNASARVLELEVLS